MSSSFTFHYSDDSSGKLTNNTTKIFGMIDKYGNTKENDNTFNIESLNEFAKIYYYSLSFNNLIKTIGILKGYQEYEEDDYISVINEENKDITSLCAETGICMVYGETSNSLEQSVKFSIAIEKFKIIKNDYPAPTISLSNIKDNKFDIKIIPIYLNSEEEKECNILYSTDNINFKSYPVKIGCTYKEEKDALSNITLSIEGMQPNTTYYVKSNVVNSKNYTDTKQIKTLSTEIKSNGKNEKLEKDLNNNNTNKIQKNIEDSPKTGIDNYIGLLSIVLSIVLITLYIIKEKDLFKNI